ncbi:Na/Pi cotransporter family protein [uncultured Aquitalea sp.]|uniref:Na/Pi cotransporter family protein n=1 Tax=uncultured Aquitalea sp. TaxID=540272 RepID=UPI0025FD182A|nr:Na/Pi cotransporter family protein [uncultured Aquitalea sp.]
MATTILLDLMGGVALLLWGLHMVHSGIVRAFGAGLRRAMSAVLRTRAHAFLAGLGVTALLQSSTATALMLSSFSASGLVDLTPALAVMLGANVGTTLIVQLLSFDSSAISPLLLVVGVVAFKRSRQSRGRDLGRVAIGLGLMLLSLHLLLTSLAPAENAPVVRTLLGALTGDPLVTLLIGALITWLAHSSVATVLLTMSLAVSGFITPLAACALVLGANLGSALNPFIEGLSSDNPAHRRLPAGNLLTRVVGCALALPLLSPLSQALAQWDADPARLAADFHTLFNAAVALLFILPLPWVSRLLTRWLPEKRSSEDPAVPLYLDASVVNTPSVALACAARETLHMGDIVETMMRESMQAILTNDRKLVAEVAQRDNAVDSLHEAIKLYVVRLTRDSLDEAEGRRAMEIMALAINLEHIGDIIDKNLMELAAKKIKRQLQFSREGAQELEAFHRLIIDNLKLSFSVFLSGDVKSARQLLDEKTRVRELEMRAAEQHLQRLREGRLESIETSSLHLDILRDLKRIHSHLCAAAYPALEAAGQLQPSRLRQSEEQGLPKGQGVSLDDPAAGHC